MWFARPLPVGPLAAVAGPTGKRFIKQNRYAGAQFLHLPVFAIDANNKLLFLEPTMVESHLKKKSHADTGSVGKPVSKQIAPPAPTDGVKKDQSGPLKASDGAEVPVDAVPDDPEDRREITRDMGLCKHCERRMTCRRPCPEGGVWHCDDYL
jgi:hypothetical protein